MCRLFKCLPSDLEREDPDLLAAFSVIAQAQDDELEKKMKKQGD